MQSTEQRLEKLERVVRWQRFGLVAVLLAAGVAMLSGADNEEPEVLTARELVIVDARGKPVGYFGNNENGTAITLTTDLKSKDGIRIGVKGKQCSISGSTGKRRFISLCDDAQCLSSVVCSDGSKASIDTSDETPQFRIDDTAGNMRLVAGSNDKSGANIGLFYEDGKVKWKTPQ